MFTDEIYISRINVNADSHHKGRIFKQRADLRPHTLVCAISGIITIKNDSGCFTAKDGEFIYIPQNTASTTFFEGEQNSFVNFFFDITSGTVSDKITVFSGNEKTAEVVQTAVTKCRSHEDNSLYFLSALYSILYEFRKNVQPDEKYKKILKAVHHIQQHPQENLKVSEYAAESFMCETSFRRIFKEFTGQSPIEYRNDLRLKRIENLVLSGETMENAIFSCGFKSPSFYYRFLKAKKQNNRADFP